MRRLALAIAFIVVTTSSGLILASSADEVFCPTFMDWVAHPFKTRYRQLAERRALKEAARAAHLARIQEMESQLIDIFQIRILLGLDVDGKALQLGGKDFHDLNDALRKIQNLPLDYDRHQYVMADLRDRAKTRIENNPKGAKKIGATFKPMRQYLETLYQQNFSEGQTSFNPFFSNREWTATNARVIETHLAEFRKTLDELGIKPDKVLTEYEFVEVEKQIHRQFTADLEEKIKAKKAIEDLVGPALRSALGEINMAEFSVSALENKRYLLLSRLDKGLWSFNVATKVLSVVHDGELVDLSNYGSYLKFRTNSDKVLHVYDLERGQLLTRPPGAMDFKIGFDRDHFIVKALDETQGTEGKMPPLKSLGIRKVMGPDEVSFNVAKDLVNGELMIPGQRTKFIRLDGKPFTEPVFFAEKYFVVGVKGSSQAGFLFLNPAGDLVAQVKLWDRGSKTGLIDPVVRILANGKSMVIENVHSVLARWGQNQEPATSSGQQSSKTPEASDTPEQILKALFDPDVVGGQAPSGASADGGQVGSHGYRSIYRPPRSQNSGGSQLKPGDLDSLIKDLEISDFDKKSLRRTLEDAPKRETD